MAFINQAVTVLQTLVIALGAGRNFHSASAAEKRLCAFFCLSRTPMIYREYDGTKWNKMI